MFSLILINILYFIRRTPHPSLVLFIIINISFISYKKGKKKKKKKKKKGTEEERLTCVKAFNLMPSITNYPLSTQIEVLIYLKGEKYGLPRTQ